VVCGLDLALLEYDMIVSREHSNDAVVTKMWGIS
jgi:hypothetical protein